MADELDYTDPNLIRRLRLLGVAPSPQQLGTSSGTVPEITDLQQYIKTKEPQLSKYHPSTGRKIGGVLLGALAGMHDPASGARVGHAIAYGPYERQQAEYQQGLESRGELAKIAEDIQNRQRQEAVSQATISSRQAAEAASRATEEHQRRLGRYAPIGAGGTLDIETGQRIDPYRPSPPPQLRTMPGGPGRTGGAVTMGPDGKPIFSPFEGTAGPTPMSPVDIFNAEQPTRHKNRMEEIGAQQAGADRRAAQRVKTGSTKGPSVAAQNAAQTGAEKEVYMSDPRYRDIVALYPGGRMGAKKGMENHPLYKQFLTQVRVKAAQKLQMMQSPIGQDDEEFGVSTYENEDDNQEEDQQ